MGYRPRCFLVLLVTSTLFDGMMGDYDPYEHQKEVEKTVLVKYPKASSNPDALSDEEIGFLEYGLTHYYCPARGCELESHMKAMGMFELYYKNPTNQNFEVEYLRSLLPAGAKAVLNSAFQVDLPTVDVIQT